MMEDKDHDDGGDGLGEEYGGIEHIYDRIFSTIYGILMSWVTPLSDCMI